jgi:hypothetical protein
MRLVLANLGGASDRLARWAVALLTSVMAVLVITACGGSSQPKRVVSTKSQVSSSSGWRLEHIDGSERMSSVSCTSRQFCLASDITGRILTFNGRSWSGPTHIVGENDVLGSLSCTSGSFCAAVGGGEELTLRGKRWTGHKVNGGEGGAVMSVSCVSSTFCAAADYGGTVNTFAGSTWGSPVTLNSGIFGVTAVSCGTPTSCLAVGTLGTNASEAQGATWRYTGSWGHKLPSGTPPNITGIDCVSASFCVAVTSAGDALTYRGTAWSAPVSVSSQGLAAVSCASETLCVAVGAGGFAVSYEGGTWRTPEKVAGAELTAVSCRAGFCVAVDMSGNAYRRG